MLWHVRINTRVKIALLGILALGLLYVESLLACRKHNITQEVHANKTRLCSATVACIVKVIYLTSYGKYNDILWDSVNLTIWTSCELNIGIFAASIATLKPLFRVTFQGSSLGRGFNNSRDQKSADKSGFVKQINNHQEGGKGNGGSRSDSRNGGFEMYGNAIPTSMKGSVMDIGMDNESQEEIFLPLQNPGIMKITQANVSISGARRTKGGYD